MMTDLFMIMNINKKPYLVLKMNNKFTNYKKKFVKYYLIKYLKIKIITN